MTVPSARLQLRVAPGGRSSAVVGRHGSGWKVRVRSAPERGKANAELVSLLAGTFAVPRASIRVVAGLSGRDKVVEVKGLSAASADALLETREGGVDP